jgi:hypothetical protein
VFSRSIIFRRASPPCSSLPSRFGSFCSAGSGCKLAPELESRARSLIGFVGVYLLSADREVGCKAERDKFFGALSSLPPRFRGRPGSMYGLRATTPEIVGADARNADAFRRRGLTVVGFIKGEWTNFNVADVSTNSWFALAYLVFSARSSVLRLTVGF